MRTQNDVADAAFAQNKSKFIIATSEVLEVASYIRDFT